MLLNVAAAVILTVLLILTHYLYSSSNIRNVTQCSSSYTYSVTYTYSITYIAAVTSAMLLNAAAAIILTALLI